MAGCGAAELAGVGVPNPPKPPVAAAKAGVPNPKEGCEAGAPNPKPPEAAAEEAAGALAARGACFMSIS